MAHFSGGDRSQLLLLPEAVDDYVGPDNAVRFIEAFVDGLDLAVAGFERVAAKETGRPGFDPADMLKLYIYGYLSRVRSSRRLETEAHRNIEAIWLLRHLKPDFRTDEKLADYMKRLDDGDAEEERVGDGGCPGGRLGGKFGGLGDKRARHKAMPEELDRTGGDQISLTDPDARAMARMTKVGVGYKVQLAVDTKHKLIAEQEVCNQVIDLGLLAPTVEAAMDTLGVERIEAGADRGYL